MSKQQEERLEFYTTQEACKLLGISYITLLRYRKAGKIKANKVGKGYVWGKRELERFINAE